MLILPNISLTETLQQLHTAAQHQDLAQFIAEGETLLSQFCSIQHADATQKQLEDLTLSATVFDNASEGIMITDANMRILRVNKAFSLITGYEASEVIGEKPTKLASGIHERAFYEHMWHMLNTRGSWQGEITNRGANGEPIAEFLTITAIENAQGDITNYVGIFRDISESKEQQSRIAHMALHDALTELPNRNSLARAFPRLANLCQRHGNMMAFLFLDLDRFKWINDSLGHEMGDHLLVAITKRLKERLRESDFISRLGGDEFVVLLPELSNARQAANVANDILQALTPEFVIGDQQLTASFSIGVSIFPQDGEAFNILMRNADNAMYHAKADGRNTFRFFNRSMDEEAQQRLTLETALRHAIQNNQLSLVYQPQTDILGNVIAAEALLRWHHPELGNVSPEVFIPIAEDNSQIRAIGDWVVETACKQLAEWNAQGFVLETLAINVSLIQLHDNKFIQRVKATIEKYNIPCHQVMLEFTESKLAQEISTLQNQLSQIRDTGIGISIDDFGTGYSNMGQLKHLKVDQIKIDRSFIQDAIENPEDQAIINAIIQMAHALKINTLAEGIETDQQWQLMQDLQVDQMQGFHFYRPLTVDDMNHLLLNRLPPI